jgi:hypothetical protein
VPSGRCDNPNCTVLTTGNCLLSHPRLEECPHFSAGDVAAIDAPDAVEPVESVEEESATTTKAGRIFHLGNELGAEDALDIMRARYTHLIGVLGSTEAGKTCLLSSLYLLASAGALPPPYQFCGSLTLQAFEDRARRLREWGNSTLPDQLADRTVFADPRRPGLLHLAVQKNGVDGQSVREDLLVTDLPGEWTENLVAHAANAKSFEFLRRADGIILVVDGTILMSDSRHVELQRMRNFSERLAREVGINRDTPFVLLVSKADEIGMQEPPDLRTLRDHISGLGFPVSVVIAAAFSRRPKEVKSGTGVFEAFDTILSHRVTKDRNETSAPENRSDRSFQRFRG